MRLHRSECTIDKISIVHAYIHIQWFWFGVGACVWLVRSRPVQCGAKQIDSLVGRLFWLRVDWYFMCLDAVCAMPKMARPSARLSSASSTSLSSNELAFLYFDFFFIFENKQNNIYSIRPIRRRCLCRDPPKKVCYVFSFSFSFFLSSLCRCFVHVGLWLENVLCVRERQPLFFALSLVIWRVSAILELDKAVVFRSFVFTRNRHAAHTFKPSAIRRVGI